MDISREELYEIISADNLPHIISTQKAIELAADKYYLFHLEHRMIDYRDVDRQLWVVVVSIDAELLNSVCSSEDNLEGSFNFMADRAEKLISYPQQEFLISHIMQWTEDQNKRQQAYEDFIRRQQVFAGNQMAVSCVYDEKFQRYVQP